MEFLAWHLYNLNLQYFVYHVALIQSLGFQVFKAAGNFLDLLAVECVWTHTPEFDEEILRRSIQPGIYTITR